MRALLIASCLAFSCGLEKVELIDVRDYAGEAEDSGVEDTGAPDMGTPDMGTPDMGTPDSGSECVCRFVRCTDTPQCESVVGAGETCHPREFWCTGFIGTCTMDSDCGGVDWKCTAGPTSLDPC